MPDIFPGREEMAKLLGPALYDVWGGLCAAIDGMYEMETVWGPGGREWLYEYKYRRGGKTLCALYAREGCIGFLVIFGRAERERFEEGRGAFPMSIQEAYDSARTYHDGKWVMFEPKDVAGISDYVRLLPLKRRPNRK